MNVLAPEYVAALDLADEQSEAPPVPCARCGKAKQRPEWIVCIGCAVTLDADFATEMAKARDVHRAWLEQAAPLLEVMDRESPLYVAGMAQQKYHRKQYEALCHLIPETPR